MNNTNDKNFRSDGKFDNSNLLNYLKQRFNKMQTCDQLGGPKIDKRILRSLIK